VFSRSVYFCVISLLVIIVDEAAKLENKSVSLYGVQLYSQSSLLFARELLVGKFAPVNRLLIC